MRTLSHLTEAKRRILALLVETAQQEGGRWYTNITTAGLCQQLGLSTSYTHRVIVDFAAEGLLVDRYPDVRRAPIAGRYLIPTATIELVRPPTEEEVEVTPASPPAVPAAWVPANHAAFVDAFMGHWVRERARLAECEQELSRLQEERIVLKARIARLQDQLAAAARERATRQPAGTEFTPATQRLLQELLTSPM